MEESSCSGIGSEEDATLISVERLPRRRGGILGAFWEMAVML